MRRPTVMVFAALLVAAGCSAAGPRTRAAAQPELPPPAEIVHQATEPEGWANAAAARCGMLNFDAKLSCYQEALLAVLGAQGVRPAMETLSRIGAHDGEARHHGHVLAHHVGIAAYRSPEEVGATFAECTPGFQSGCFHGVIQAYFAAWQGGQGAAPGAEPMNRLCEAHRGAGGNRWLLFQCVHGIGHGLVALYDSRLPRALQGCDLLRDEWEREGCYGGAFMENVVSATMPHHGPRPEGHARHAAAGGGGAPGEPHAHAGSQRQAQAEHPEQGGHHPHHAGGHAGHDHAEAAAPHPAAAAQPAAFRQLDPADPHYPCSALDERYLFSCYSMQTSAVLFWSEGDLAPGIRLCEEAPERVRSTCFTSLGRDINAYTHQNHAAAIAGCMRVGEAFQPACLIGVAKNLIDRTAEPGDGAAFCSALPAGRNRERCFQAVGEQIAVLEREPARRAAACAPLKDVDARACRSGAGVRDEVAARPR